MKALQKDTIREIKGSMTRFISILAIIALGICFYSGIKSTGPSMEHTANLYYQEQSLMDIRLVSTYGFQDNDIKEIEKTPGVNTVMPAYSGDVILENGDNRAVLKLISLPPKDGLNQPVLLEGRLPENENEILFEKPNDEETVVDLGDIYKLGDTIKLSDEVGDKSLTDTVRHNEFMIVGFVRSPQYVSIERGNTTVGSGSVSYYGFVPESAFTLERFSEVYLLSDASAQGVSCFTSDYWKEIESLETKMDKLGIERLEVNHTDIMNKAQEELDKGKTELEDAKRLFFEGIASGETSLADAKVQLVSGEIEYNAGVVEYDNTITQTQAELDQARALINQGEAELKQGEITLAQELADGEVQLESARQGIMQLEDAIAQMEAHDPSGQLPDLLLQEEAAQIQVDLTQDVLDLLLVQEQEIKDEIVALDPSDPDYPAKLAALEAQLADLQPQITAATLALEIAEAQLLEIQTNIAAIYEFQAQLQALQTQLVQAQDALVAGEAALEQARIQGQAQLDAGWAELNQQKVVLANGIAAFEVGKIEGQELLDASKNELDQGWIDYQQGQRTLEEERINGQEKINDGTIKLQDAKAKVDDIEFGKWYIFNRDDNPGYTSYGEDAKRIDNMSDVFPMFFLLVAALVSFTTMTRMVEEQRTQIGTLKALGYKSYQIASKYFIYAFLAAIIGSGIGLILGINTLPYLIVGAYSLLYQMPSLSIAIPWVPILISCIIAVLCTITAAIAVSYIELRAHPSELMRPKAPKIGKRIFLERIPLIWKNLGFIEKVTARNLMRYKGRFFMTVIGIAGCTALILAGFGLQDAIFSIIPQQFENISVYDGMIAFKTDGTLEEKSDIKLKLNEENRFSENMLVYQTTMKIEKVGNDTEKEAFLFVPESSKSIENFVYLHDRKTQEFIDLDQAKVVISEMIAKDLNLKVGDQLKITNDDLEKVVTLGAITENYLQNYLYLSPETYEDVFGHKLKVNLAYVNMPDTSKENEKEVAKDWLEDSGVVAINFVGDIVSSTNDSLSSLNIVVLVMILAAGALAVVVLYNLTNINISERVREIATIRVLGFYDMEVYKYIFRENLVLSAIGIIVGLGLGVILNGYIILTIETDIVMFGRGIQWTSYLYSVLFTMGFTFLVNIIMTPMIKRISMVESLKSVE
jgi:putative ABC transport system permease protein